MQHQTFGEWIDGLTQCSESHESWRDKQGFTEDERKVANAIYCADLGLSGFPIQASRDWFQAKQRIGEERTEQIREMTYAWFKDFLAKTYGEEYTIENYFAAMEEEE